MRELGIDERGAIEEQPIKILVVLVPQVVIRSREIRVGALQQIYRKGSVMSDSTRLVKPAQEIEFNGHALIHCREPSYYPGVLGTIRRSSAQGGRAVRIRCEAMGQWLCVVRQRASV